MIPLIFLLTGALWQAQIVPAAASSGFTFDNAAAQRVLGHDPHVQLLEEANIAVVKKQRKTVYFHGFGANGDVARAIKQSRPQALPGDVVTFDFVDAASLAGMQTAKSSLGQWPDAKVPLYILNRLYENGEREIGINGHSRGGATAVNLVAILQDTSNKYDEQLSQIGIDRSRQYRHLN